MKNRGISFFSLIVMVVFFGLLCLGALQLGPLYLQDYTIGKIFSNLAKDPILHNDSLSPNAITNVLQKNMDLNSIDEPKASQAKIIPLATGGYLVTLNYTKQIYLFSNYELLIHFHQNAVVKTSE